MPAAPRTLKYYDIGRDSVTLAWEPPTHDGGARVLSYVIEKRDPRRDRWALVHKVTYISEHYNNTLPSYSMFNIDFSG